MKYSRYFSGLALLLAVALPGVARSAQVHVHQCTCVAGVTEERSDTTASTGEAFKTDAAPDVTGYIFTHWTISTQQAFAPRDRHGRAYDAVSFTPYEETTLTAQYIPETTDEDGDGLPDGYELYWYGDLDEDGASDTDGDGCDLAAEYAAGTIPVLADRAFNGGVVWEDSDETWYNPNSFGWVSFRCEPEGLLFETTSNIVIRGTPITSPKCDPTTTTFAYWKANGTRVADRNGRAVDQVSAEMGSKSVEYVAVCIDDETERAQYYWYGKAQPLDSDSDGDGYTFGEEIAAGTNPLLKDRSFNGGVVWEDGDLITYHTTKTRLCTFRCEPEGALFETVSDYQVVGTEVETPSVADAETFAYWTTNGVRVTDSHGRAKDSFAFSMPNCDCEVVAVSIDDETERTQYYWYGRAQPLDSDSDGDGYTFAQELAAGTNPLLFDRAFNGGVVWEDSVFLEVDLQPFEKPDGLLVNGAYTQFAGLTFGANLTPYVVDFDGDSHFDLVLKDDSGVRFYRNVGAPGAPAFEEKFGIATDDIDFGTNDVARLADLSLETQPTDALTATYGDANQDGLVDILVSDASGRIWYYAGRGGDAASTWALQHKVWGGTRAGFANGLRIAAVDWDDDGDLDCLCGTAEGKLMLLTDPRPGHPSNLKAAEGVSDVELSWNATSESRVRGFNVYRANASAGDWGKIGEPTLPAYRDAPADVAHGYDYRVTTVSRFYTAGNSEPMTYESSPTDAVRVEFGKVRFVWRPAAGFVGDTVDVVLSAENAHGLDAATFQLQLTYDDEVLEPVEAKRSGITENLEFLSTASGGSWIIHGTGGEIVAGTGAFLTFSFRVLDRVALASTAVSIADFQLKSVGKGHAVTPVMDQGDGATNTVSLTDAEHPDSSYVPAGSLGDLDGDGRLTEADRQLFVKWKDAAADAVPAAILKAGDYNGDGRLNNKDFHLMKKDFAKRAPSDAGSNDIRPAWQGFRKVRRVK